MLNSQFRTFRLMTGILNVICGMDAPCGASMRQMTFLNRLNFQDVQTNEHYFRL